MSYSYYATAAPARSLEAILKDDAACSDSSVYRTADTSAVDNLLHAASKKFIDSHSTADAQTFLALHGNRAVQTGMITGIVRLILPRHTFTQRNGRPGFVQTFIIVNLLAERLNSDVWRFKIVVWNEQAKT